jgi:hypothetical protein
MNNILSHVLVFALGIMMAAFGVMRMMPQQQPPLGSAAGPDMQQHINFYDNMTVGGADFATSSQGTVTYTAASIANSRVIEHKATAALTATLPTNTALSAVGFLPKVGDTQTLFIHASTTKVTLAGNTGVTLFSASSTKDVAAGSIGRLECTRLGATEGRLIWCILSAD